MSDFDLSAFAAPDAIEAYDYEVILAALMADVQARFDAAGISYDVGELETDPVKIVLETSAYREVLIRARINDAVRANLLAFAGGADLDHLAAFYDVVRLEGEPDTGLRARTIVAIRGRSTAGPRDWYRTAAFAADPNVADVAVYRPGTGPDITVAILARDNNGVPSAELLATIDAVMQSNSVRAISDRVTTVAATQASADVVADIWLLLDAPAAIFDGLADRLRDAIDAEGGLGFDVTRSWLTAKLHQVGVQKVVLNSPASDLIVADNAAVRINTITLTYKGRDR